MQAKQGEETGEFVLSVLCMSLPLLQACANFPLANPGPSLYPFLDESCFLHFSLDCLSLLSRGTWLPLLQRDFPRGADKRLSLSEQALCPGGSSTLQLGNRQLRRRFNGHLQQVGSKHFYCALEALHTHVTAEYGLQDYISVNKSHFPSRKQWAFSCTLPHKLWSSYLTIITTETMTTSNTT